jgi:hypothetical protein
MATARRTPQQARAEREAKKTTTVTTTEVAPKTAPAVRFVDYGSGSSSSPTTSRSGGATIVGGSVGGGGGGTIIQSDIPVQQTQQLTQVKTTAPQVTSTLQRNQYQQQIVQAYSGGQQNQKAIQNQQQIRGTSQIDPRTYPQPDKRYTIYTQPTIETRQVGTYKNVPVTQDYLLEPPKSGVGVWTEKEVYSTRFAGGETYNLGDEYEPLTIYNEEVASTNKQTTTNRVKDYVYSSASYKGVKNQLSTQVIPESAIQKLNTSITNIYDIALPRGTSEFLGSAVTSVIPRTKGDIYKDLAIYGLGSGVGVAGKGVVAIAGRVSPRLATATKVGGIGVGTYLTGTYAVDVGTKIYAAPTYSEKGSIFGKSVKEMVLFGSGYKSGGKIVDRISVIGRDYVPIENLVPKDVLTGKEQFVVSRSYGYKGKTGLNKQKFDLNVFIKKQYAYHTTPSKFWINGILVKGSTSEFQGLYVAPEVSVYFSKVGGGKYKLLPSIKDLISVDNPAIARIKGKGFSIYNKNDLNVGYVTGIKPEIEAVYPVGSEFLRTGKGLYTIFKGRIIKIDTFKYADATTPKIKTITSTEISSKYGYIDKEPILEPYPIYQPSYKTSTYKPIKYSVSSVSSTSSINDLSSYTKPSYKGSGSSGISSFISSSISSTTPSSISKTPRKPESSISSKPSPSLSSISSFIKGSSSRSYLKPIRKTPTPKTPKIPKFKPYSQTRQSKGSFSVFGKRFGKFKLIGVSKTPLGAVGIGRNWASKTLGATFKVPKYKGSKVAGFRTKKTKEGLVFIESEKKRLSKRTEVKEINLYKNVKGGKKK